MSTGDIRWLSDAPGPTLATLIMKMEFIGVSILDYKLYIDDSKTPIILESKADYEPYLDYHPFYIIEDATFDNIRYTKAIRIISPKTTQSAR